MRESMTVEELVCSKELTSDEAELHRQLEEECHRREERILEFSRSAQLHMEDLSDSLARLRKKTEDLGNAIKVLQEQADNLYLKLLPEDIFYHD